MEADKEAERAEQESNNANIITRNGRNGETESTLI